MIIGMGLTILGIETSCDETAAALVEIDDKQNCTLLSNVVLSSMDLHAKYGGVVPELAARSHVESAIPVIEEATKGIGWDEIDGIAVTYGAGLGGSLLVGVMTARTLAIIKNKPLFPVNHVEAHIYANFINRSKLDGYSLPVKQPAFPILGVIVSGGHSQLVLFQNHFEYTLLGRTQDDAIGEAFDKVAKITGLPYPGGPSVGALAKHGDAYAFNLPKAKMSSVNPNLNILRSTRQASSIKSQSYDFSFSGLKTAVLRQAQELIGEDYTFPSKDLPERLSEAQKANIAATFQRTAVETIVDKVILAYEEFSPATVVIGGGVAASPELRRQLSERLPIGIEYQDPKLMTDNGAMVAALGSFKAFLNQDAADPYSLDIFPNLSM